MRVCEKKDRMRTLHGRTLGAGKLVVSALFNNFMETGSAPK